jgi:ABC-type dipeptide/oligopeptide/nickel transport system permease component
MLIVVWTAVTLTFIMSRLIPADPARLAAGLQAGPEQVEEVRRQLGLDLPIFQQYINYLSGIVRLDLGKSIQTRQPVIDDIFRYLPATLELVFAAFFIYAFFGILFGVLWARFPKSFLSKSLSIFTVLGVAMPVFWIGLILQVVFAANLKWLPLAGNLSYSKYQVEFRTGMGTVDSLLGGNLLAFQAALLAMVLPVTALVISQIAVSIRLTRTSMITELQKPYVKAARARGVREWRITTFDALRNALNPVITMLGLQFGWLLGGTILVEVVFSWPGLGLYAFNAFRTFDYNPILAITLVITVTFVLVNELVSLLYPLLDPRIKK